MSYLSTPINIQTGIDEFAYEFAVYRREGESVSSFRRRLIAEIKDPKKPTQVWLDKNASRLLGLKRTPAIRIDLILDNSEPVAADPYIEITSSKIKIYDDYSSEIPEFDFELKDISYGELVSQINLSSNFEASLLDESLEHFLITELQVDNSFRFVKAERLPPTKSLKFKNKLIKDIFPSYSDSLTNEVNSINDVTSSGDYFVDYTNGVVFSFDTVSSPISYRYRLFPFTLWKSPIRVMSFDSDIDFVLKDKKQSFYGLELPGNLNSYGMNILSNIYNVHPLNRR